MWLLHPARHAQRGRGAPRRTHRREALEPQPARTAQLVAAVLAAAEADFSESEVLRLADGRPDVLELALAVHHGPRGTDRAIIGALRLVG